MIEFVVEKKLLDSAMKQLLFGRSSDPDDLVDIAVSGSLMTFVARGSSVEVPVKSEAAGRISIPVSDLAKLKKLSATYKAGPMRLRISDGRIRFQNTSLALDIRETKAERRLIDIPNDASALDLASLPFLFTAEEIDQCGLTIKVLEAKKALAELLEESITKMSEFGLTRSQLTVMAEEQLRAHTANMRHVLLPKQGVKNIELPTGEVAMNEAEMKAELERLRAENAQLKTKEKGGITLKVSEKGAISLYGMGKFPVTLYKEQWLRVLASAPQIEAFIRDNETKLKTKE